MLLLQNILPNLRETFSESKNMFKVDKQVSWRRSGVLIIYLEHIQ